MAITERLSLFTQFPSRDVSGTGHERSMITSGAAKFDNSRTAFQNARSQRNKTMVLTRQTIAIARVDDPSIALKLPVFIHRRIIVNELPFFAYLKPAKLVPDG